MGHPNVRFTRTPQTALERRKAQEETARQAEAEKLAEAERFAEAEKIAEAERLAQAQAAAPVSRVKYTRTPDVLLKSRAPTDQPADERANPQEPARRRETAGEENSARQTLVYDRSIFIRNERQTLQALSAALAEEKRSVLEQDNAPGAHLDPAVKIPMQTSAGAPRPEASLGGGASVINLDEVKASDFRRRAHRPGAQVRSEPAATDSAEPILTFGSMGANFCLDAPLDSSDFGPENAIGAPDLQRAKAPQKQGEAVGKAEGALAGGKVRVRVKAGASPLEAPARPKTTRARASRVCAFDPPDIEMLAEAPEAAPDPSPTNCSKPTPMLWKKRLRISTSRATFSTPTPAPSSRSTNSNRRRGSNRPG